MTKSARRLLVAYLALVVAGLGYLNWWQANTHIDISPLITEPAGDTLKTDAGAIGAPQAIVPTLAQLTETVARPVFRSDRRPLILEPSEEQALPVASEPDPSLVSPESLRLVGVMRSGTSARRALIRVAGTAAATWVETGAEVSGWTVEKIETDRVFFARNGDKAELKLFAPKPAEAPPK